MDDRTGSLRTGSPENARSTNAFPITDVGLHNAIKKQLNLKQKPSLEEIEQWSDNWKGWEAYATFYLWHSLL